MEILHLTTANFEEEVMNSNEKVLIDFWATWCGPCQRLGPVIEELAKEVTDAKICKVNVDEEGDIATKFKIMSIPTLIVIKDGKVVNKAVGEIDKKSILSMLNN